MKDDEVIILNTISAKTKYGEILQLTNLKIGDKYTLTIDGQERVFTIAGIVDNFEPYLEMTNIENPSIIQIVNDDTAETLNQTAFGFSLISIDTNSAYDIDKFLKEIDENQQSFFGINIYETRVSEESQRAITEIVAYSFVGLVALVSIINIFNTISFSVFLRKRELSILKSMGMSDKQINKMMTLEGIFYGLDSILYGTLISIAILYVIYLFMVETKLYLFNIPFRNILISIFVIYITIFVAIGSAKRKIKDCNIIETIKEENI